MWKGASAHSLRFRNGISGLVLDFGCQVARIPVPRCLSPDSRGNYSARSVIIKRERIGTFAERAEGTVRRQSERHRGRTANVTRTTGFLPKPKSPRREERWECTSNHRYGNCMPAFDLERERGRGREQPHDSDTVHIKQVRSKRPPLALHCILYIIPA